MKKTSFTLAATLALSATTAYADCSAVMNSIGGHSNLTTALQNSVAASGGPSNGGLDLNMWATIVSDDGTVCAVTKTGSDINDQWLGSRVISAQKANTANSFSLQNGLALSTANLWAPTQPGGSLFGLQFSNPVDTTAAYTGDSANFGSASDPMTGSRIGGVNVFGGGLALYDEEGNMIGAIGVSGDSSCADHNIAWRTRDAIELDHVPAGLSGVTADNIIYDINRGTGKSASGFGHPECFGEKVINEEIVINHPIGSNS